MLQEMNGSKDYTAAAYKKLLSGVETKLEALNEQAEDHTSDGKTGNSANSWTAQTLEEAVWARSVLSKAHTDSQPSKKRRKT